MTNAWKALIKQLSFNKTVSKEIDSDNHESSNLPTPKASDEKDQLWKIIVESNDINFKLKWDMVNLRYQL